jgi:hypothetical protein
MSPAQPSKPLPGTDQRPCKHPRVQLVSRDEETEFVECLECREVFESSEFNDMTVEDQAQSGEV